MNVIKLLTTPSNFTILPAVVSPAQLQSGAITIGGERQTYEDVQASAIAEAFAFNDVYRDQPDLENPKLPWFHGGTAHGLIQKLRLVVNGYNDMRLLPDADIETCASPFGTLSSAIPRAIARHAARGLDGGAPILEIGGGNRGVAWQLKHLFGEKITTHEVSPKYGKLKNAIDVEFPASTIDNARLPRGTFETVYSIYGSFYGHDQLQIMQNVIDSLKVGGEAYLMWDSWRPSHSLYARLIQNHAGFFQQNGVDISATKTESPTPIGLGGKYYDVWIRKRSGDIDMPALFKAARSVNIKDPTPHLRLTFNGPDMTMEQGSQEIVHDVMQQMFSGLTTLIGADPGLIEHKLNGKGPYTPVDPSEGLERLTQKAIKDMGFRLAMGLPLTASAVLYMAPAISVLGSNLTVSEQREKDLERYSRLITRG